MCRHALVLRALLGLLFSGADLAEDALVTARSASAAANAALASHAATSRGVAGRGFAVLRNPATHRASSLARRRRASPPPPRCASRAPPAPWPRRLQRARRSPRWRAPPSRPSSWPPRGSWPQLSRQPWLPCASRRAAQPPRRCAAADSSARRQQALATQAHGWQRWGGGAQRCACACSGERREMV